MSLSIRHRAARLSLFLAPLAVLAPLTACGGSAPPPKTEVDVEDTATEAPRRTSRRGGPMVEQELGSIDPRAVEETFAALSPKLESCHRQGRDRVEYLAGDAKVFLRIGKDGRVKYGWFEESTLGDRETEACILDRFASADWPKPEGGEAEVRNGFGWPAGSERQPASWGPEKVIGALEADEGAKKSVEQCRRGVTGDFIVTAYVEPHEPEAAQGKGEKKSASAKKKGEHQGRFKALGVAAPSKEGAEKVGCLIDALEDLALPSPGSYAAKVTFKL